MDWFKHLTNAVLAGGAVALAQGVIPSEYVAYYAVGAAVLTNAAGLVQKSTVVPVEEKKSDAR